jgi:phosphatidylserine decarboxylase
MQSQENYLLSKSPTLTILCIIVAYLTLGKVASVVTFLTLYYMYRAPNRLVRTKMSEGLIYFAPADGLVTRIDDELHSWRVCIYLNLFNVHVQYSPCKATVVSKEYHVGRFIPAFFHRKSDDNERLTTTFMDAQGNPFKVIQIAGTFASTIESFLEKNQMVKPAEHIGMIKFGSRVDLIVPKKSGYVPLVSVGQRVVAGRTIAFKKLQK